MIKLTVLYGHPTDPAAFEDYYNNTHTPIALKMTGYSRFEAGFHFGRFAVFDKE